MIAVKFRYWLYLLISVSALTAFSYELLDQPIAWFAHRQLHQYSFFAPLTVLTEYFPPLAIVTIGLLGLLSLAGYVRGRGFEALLVSAISLVVARAAKDQLKLAFGRTWPETWTNNNPSLIKDGVYGFHPFHGGLGYEAFPSGHMVGICSVVVTLWFYYPRLWPVYVSVILIVATGLIGANYHFLSDILAGSLVGSSAAVFCQALFACETSTVCKCSKEAGQQRS
jgi:membrane-associated phospholipid phosphatase